MDPQRGNVLPRDRHRRWHGVQGCRPYLQGLHLRRAERSSSKVKIEGEKATLISVVGGVEKTFDVTVKEGKLSFHSFSLGNVVREGNQLKLEIALTNDLLKKMPLSHFANSEAGIILKAIADQNLDLKIKATGTK